MALPSSPPLLPEIDLPTSSPPPLPISSASSVRNGAYGRKRPFSDYGSQSSDPLFSDTASDAEQLLDDDDGVPSRRKRVVRGPWWNLRRASTRSLRQTMAKKENFRNADSGVWMGSDEHDDGSSDGPVLPDEGVLRLDFQGISEHEHEPPHIALASDAEALAAKIIQNSVDNGQERIDLSDLGLHALSDATLRPLHQLIKPSHLDLTQPPSEDQFVPLTPSIQLFIYRNSLSTLPPELFTLTNVTVLSLRNNLLEELPPVIARLRNLKELNISGNGIRFLPWELVEMFNHRHIVVRPNPLIEPADLSGPSPLPRPKFQRAGPTEEPERLIVVRDIYQDIRTKFQESGCLDLRGELELRLKLGRMARIQHLQEMSRAGRKLKLCAEELIHLASSEIRCFNVDGTPVRSTAPAVEAEDEWPAVLEPGVNSATLLRDCSAVPSLFELCIRSLQTNFDPQSICGPSEGFPIDVPPAVASALRKASQNVVQNGNDVCSTCNKAFVIARAQWMEYWFHGLPSEAHLEPQTVLPFLRKACSWACARPSKMGDFRC